MVVILPHPIAVHGSLNGLEKAASKNSAQQWLPTFIDADDGRQFKTAKKCADHSLLKKNFSQPSVASSNASLTNTCSSSSSLSVFRVSQNSAFSPFVAVVQQRQKGERVKNMTRDEKFCTRDGRCVTASSSERITFDNICHRNSEEIHRQTNLVNENDFLTQFSSRSDLNGTENFENSFDYCRENNSRGTSGQLKPTEPTTMTKLRKPIALTAPRLLQENFRISNDNNPKLFTRRPNHLKLSNVLLPLKYEEIFPLCLSSKDELGQKSSPVHRKEFFSVVELNARDAFDREAAFTLPLSKDRRKLETWRQKDSHCTSMRDVVQKIRKMENALQSWSFQ